MALFNWFKGKKENPFTVLSYVVEYEVKLAEARRRSRRFKRLHKGYDNKTVMAEGDERAKEVVSLLLFCRIDPDNDYQYGFHFVEALDLARIYGHNIAVFHYEVCGGDLTKSAAVLKAYLMGWIDAADIRSSVENPLNPAINADAIKAKVQRAMPRFKLGR